MNFHAMSYRSAFTIAALGVGFAMLADCKRNAATEQARVEAERIENRGEQQADRLRDQARNLENEARAQGHAEAEQLRERANQIREQSRAQAHAIENRAENTPSDRSGVAPSQAQGGGPVVAAHVTLARETYAAARCDREVRCSQVGPGRRHASREACLQAARTDRNDSWDASDCQNNGINQNELDECLTAVRNEDCGSPIDALQRLSQCRAGEICRH